MHSNIDNVVHDLHVVTCIGPLKNCHLHVVLLSVAISL